MAILAVNVLVFLVTDLFLPEETATLVYSAGALYWPAVIEGKEYYRLLTSAFLHYGSAHLANNMLILFVIGSRLEDVIGKWKFAVLYFVSGILAGMTSIGYNMLQNRAAIAAGASGAIFGLVGGMVWVVIAERGKVQGLGIRQMIVFAALSLYGGFVEQYTDNAAHLGGMAAGFLLAMLLYRGRRRKREGGRI